ncbi:hypothetical protein AB0C34_04920 [Nocardia sp. NPDC049220]|uniref:hypothetical protein n=1 Tax=Nocardia sp. NPDC049220 TaxID=3155273 RepID=UPI0033D5FFA7
MSSSQLDTMHRAIDTVLSISHDFTAENIGAACSAELREVDSSNPYIREFQGKPQDSPFSAISLRLPRTPPAGPDSVLVLTPAVRLTQADLTDRFDLSPERADINPHIPPEGTISFRETRGNRTLVLQFTARSRILRMIAINEADSTTGPHTPVPAPS